jgi:hypothetical protein
LKQRISALAVVCIALGALAVVSPSYAQESSGSSTRRTIVAARVPDGESIQIDGVLDETAWRSAQPATDFLQRDPRNGAPATERTEVRVLFEPGRLVIGAMLYDSEPDRLLGNQMQRDQSFSADDRFIVSIDTFADGRGGYVFQTNPVGAQADALIVPSTNTNDQTVQEFGASLNSSWDGIWIGRVRRTADGWSAELEIPFRTLNFDPNLDAWGINFQRTVRRKTEESVWSGHLRNEGVGEMSSAGRLQGLSDISQGVGLDIKPYVVGNLSAAPGRGRPGGLATGDVGADLFYNVTPALRANVSINTDFAETEVDARQVNLTRFPLFFEEKRDFFLQGSSYFDFAREIGNQVMPFFSRTIGLDARGVPQPIDVGAKLTGQAGAFDIGVLQVRTAETAAQIGSDFTVARVRRRFLRQSYVGGLYTRRSDRQAGLPDRYTVGADMALRTSTAFGNKLLEFSNWFLYTTNPLDTGENIGRGSRIAFPNDPFYFDLSFRELQANYRPAAGFVQRNGFTRVNPEIGYTWRFRGHPWIRSIQQEIDWQFFLDTHNRMLTQNIATRPLTMVLNDGSSVHVEAEPTYERLEQDFEISSGVVLPGGRSYRYTRYQIEGSMADRYPVAVGVSTQLGDFFSGTRKDFAVNVRVRPRTGVAVRFEAEHSALDLAEGSFDTTVFRVIANTQFSPWLTLSNNVQYDDVTKLLGWQMRFRWIQRPGNDVFFVYTHNWHELETPGERRMATLDHKAATKVVYTLRF